MILALSEQSKDDSLVDLVKMCEQKDANGEVAVPSESFTQPQAYVQHNCPTV